MRLPNLGKPAVEIVISPQEEIHAIIIQGLAGLEGRDEAGY